MSDPISLFCIGDLSGGIKSYSIHLQRLLELHYDCKVTLYKVKPRTEGRKRLIYGDFHYVNVDADDAVEIANETPSIITYFANYKRSLNADYCRKLLEYGIPIVVQDLRGLNGIDEKFLATNVVVMSEAAHAQIPGSKLLYQPYIRFGGNKTNEFNAICMTRVDREKHTDMILEANKLIGLKNLNIHLCGIVDRLYEYRSLKDKYPNWRRYYMGTPELLGYTAQGLVGMHRFAVDMSTLKNDGGRTQYSFFEAMDVGTTLVVNNEWLKYPGDMKDGYNCIGVSTPEELAIVVKGSPVDLSEGYAKTLKFHSSWELAESYMEVMNGA